MTTLVAVVESVAPLKYRTLDAPGMSMTGRGEFELRWAAEAVSTGRAFLRRQVDFYFSDSNLEKDGYLRSQMDASNLTVPISVVAGFNRVDAVVKEALGEAVSKYDKYAFLEWCIKGGLSNVELIYIQGAPFLRKRKQEDSCEECQAQPPPTKPSSEHVTAPVAPVNRGLGMSAVLRNLRNS